MRETVKSLGRNSLVYGLGSIVQRLLMVLLLPVYTRYLAPDDYGILAILNATGSFVRPLAWLGMGQALLWAVSYREADEKVCFSSGLCFLAVQGTLLAGLLVALAGPLTSLIFGDAAHAGLLRLVALTILCEGFEVLLVSYARIHERASLFARVMVARFVVLAAASVLFLVVFKRGLPGLMEAALLTSALFAALSLWLVRRVVALRVDWPVLRQMLRFSLPLAPAQALSMVLVYADRYFIQRYRGESEVGLYALGYSLAMVLNLVVQAVHLAWVPQMYRISKAENAGVQFRRLLNYYTMALAAGGLMLSVFSPEVLRLLATPAYREAGSVVPLIAASHVLIGLGLMANVGINTENKTFLTTVLVAVTAPVNLGLNALLIPRWGMMGAAVATFLSYLLQTALLIAINQRLRPIPYDYLRMTGAIGLAAILFLAAQALSMHCTGLPLVGLKLLLAACYPAGLWWLRIVPASDREALRRGRLLSPPSAC